MRSLLRKLFSVSLLFAASCGQLRPEPMPYRFSAPLIENQRRARARAARSPRRRRVHQPAKVQPRLEAWRVRALQRCRQLVGAEVKDQDLLRAVYGSQLPKRIEWRSIKLRRRGPRPADLVLFDLGRGRIKAGVVTGRKGPRVSFIHVVGARARQGWLHLKQPNRRRLTPDPTIANSYVRPKAPGDEKNARYLAGQLLSGFGSPPRDG